MALTPALAFGRLELDYNAYGFDHVMRFWVTEFGVDAGVGTFVGSGTPLDLDGLATALTAVIGPQFATASGLAWGAWRGLKTTSIDTGAGIPIVEGTITPGSYTLQSDPGNAGAVGQNSWAFRDAQGHVVKYVMLGSVYFGPIPFKYSSMSATYKAFSDYITGSNRITSKNANIVSGLIDLTFDTNDGFTRHIRR